MRDERMPSACPKYVQTVFLIYEMCHRHSQAIEFYRYCRQQEEYSGMMPVQSSREVWRPLSCCQFDLQLQTKESVQFWKGTSIFLIVSS